MPSAKNQYAVPWRGRAVNNARGIAEELTGNERYAKGMSSKNKTALADLGVGSPGEARDLLPQRGFRVETGEQLEIAFCEIGRTKLTSSDKAFLRTTIAHYPEYVPTGRWRTQLTAQEWHAAVFNCAPREGFLVITESGGAFYNPRHSLKALKMWFCTHGGLLNVRSVVLTEADMVRCFGRLFFGNVQPLLDKVKKR